MSIVKFLLVCADSVAGAGVGSGLGKVVPAAIPPPGVGRMTPPSRGVNWPRRHAPHYTSRSKGTDPAITGEPPEEPDPGAPAPSARSRTGRDSPSQLETKRSCTPSLGGQHGKRGGTAVRHQPGTSPGREPTSSSSGPGHPPEAAGTSETRAHRDG